MDMDGDIKAEPQLSVGNFAVTQDVKPQQSS